MKIQRIRLENPRSIKALDFEPGPSDGAGGWRHTEIRFPPEGPDFAPIILRDVRDDEFHVIAELVEVLPTS